MGVDHQDPDQERVRGSHPAMNVALATPLFVLGGALIVLSIARLVTTLRHKRRLQSILHYDSYSHWQSHSQSKYIGESKWMAWLKKHIFYAPLFSSSPRHSAEFRLRGWHMGSLPLRLETILVTVYIGVNAAFFVALVDWFHLQWKEVEEDYQELLYQLKYAAGHLAVMNLPGLVLAAGRNNPLILVTGLSFDRFNLGHRWVGRVVGGGGVLHVVFVAVGRVERGEFITIFIIVIMIIMIIVFLGLKSNRLVGIEETTHVLWHAPFYVYGMIVRLSKCLKRN